MGIAEGCVKMMDSGAALVFYFGIMTVRTSVP